MRYLIPAAGVGRRMGGALRGLPKCMIEIAGEPLIVRLLRQIRGIDAEADIHVVLGYRREIVLPVLGNASVIVNPLFDVTGIDTSLWFARRLFDRAMMVVHADLVLSDRLAKTLLTAESPTLMAYDGSIRTMRVISTSPLQLGASRDSTRTSTHTTASMRAFSSSRSALPPLLPRHWIDRSAADCTIPRRITFTSCGH